MIATRHQLSETISVTIWKSCQFIKNRTMQSIFNTDVKQPPTIDMFKPLPTDDGVIDEATFKTIEVDALFDAVY